MTSADDKFYNFVIRSQARVLVEDFHYGRNYEPEIAATVERFVLSIGYMRRIAPLKLTFDQIRADFLAAFEDFTGVPVGEYEPPCLL